MFSVLGPLGQGACFLLPGLKHFLNLRINVEARPSNLRLDQGPAACLPSSRFLDCKGRRLERLAHDCAEGEDGEKGPLASDALREYTAC